MPEEVSNFKTLIVRLKEILNLTDTPLNKLSEKELCPGSESLKKINESLR